MNEIEKKDLITTKERAKVVRDFDYGEVVSSDLEDIDLPRMSFENYNDLELYLENEFIPKYMKTITKKNKFTNQNETYLSIALNCIIKLKLSYKEFQYVINYLNDKGIIIRGRLSTLDYDIPNYVCVSTYKNQNNNNKFEKDTDEEIKLFKIYKKTNDKNIKEKIIINNIRIAKSIAKKYAIIYKLDINELESYAYEGLCKAVDSFDYTKMINFSTYVYSTIEGHIKHGVADIKNNYRNGTYRNYYYKVNSYIYKVEKSENKKISEDQNLIDKVVDLMISDGKIKLSQRDTFKKYIYSSLILSFDTGNVDILLDDRFENIIHKTYLRQLKNTIEEILSDGFTEQETIVIKKSFGINERESMKLTHIGKELGLSRERIRQIERKALQKLKHPKILKKLESFNEGFNQFEDTMDLYNYIEEDNYYTEDIYDDNYDYKKPPRR